MVKSVTSETPKLGVNSLLFKCALLCGLVVFAVMAIVEWRALRMERDTMTAALTDRARDVSTLLAQQVGGSIASGDRAALKTIVDEVLAETQPDAVGIWVADAKLEPLYQGSRTDMNLDEVRALARRVSETGQSAQSASGYIVARPSYPGGADAIAGVVVTEWSDARILAQLRDKIVRIMVVGTAVFLLGQLGLAVFLWATVSRPLMRLEAAMGRVARQDYESDVPFAQRRDEIGLIARRLQRFRDTLAAAKDTEVSSRFQSAAFQGSTAPMMMVNQSHEVLFINKTCLALLEGLESELKSLWPAFDAEAVIGADLSRFSPLHQIIKDVETTGPGSLPQSVNVRIGSQIIRIKVNAALDEAGDMIGAVIEWSDRSVSQRNAAVLSSIDNNQLRLEFTSDGRCSEANANAEALFGPSGDLSLSSLMNTTQTAQEVPDDVARAVLRGEALRGTFDTIGRTGAVSVEGGFAIVQTPDGGLERAIFLGTDVTESTLARRKARDEQLRASREQSEVVAALEAHLKLLAGGDLSAAIKTVFPEQYEALRRDFNNALHALTRTITTVETNATSIRSETGEISNAAEDLSRRTEKQAATLEETAAAIEQLTSSVRSASEGADAASTMARKAQINAENGGSVARDAVRAMDGIKTSSQQISKITSVIDDIAFQTNLLALNAGVEAARAGDAGRGFAVVATEVRALAQRSSEAAREINELISASGAQVQEGVDLVDQTGAALGSIVSSIAEITNRVTDIASSSREQAAGLQQINEAMNELDAVTQQNAAMFEETTAASHALISETDALLKAVAVFKLAGGETDSGPAISKATTTVTPGQVKTRSTNPPQPAPRQAGNTVLQMDQASLAAAVEPDGWEEF